MAHEKVYGICENKCKVEVLPKDDLVVASISFSTQLATNEVNTVIRIPIADITNSGIVLGLYNHSIWLPNASKSNWYLNNAVISSGVLQLDIYRTGETGTVVDIDLTGFNVLILKGTFA